MFLSIDDTDSAAGGCTTEMLFHVLAELPDLAPRGMPRLVRLNPNVPWKTRGNGAVCVELVRPSGAHAVVGEWQGLEMRAYPDGEAVPATPDVLAAAWAVIEQLSQPDAFPAVALFDSSPSPLHYWAAVRTLVEPSEVQQFMTAQGILHRARGDGRALIGCLASASWSGPATSYEFIAYRTPERIGSPRSVNSSHLYGLDKTGITFHTEDSLEGALSCVPNTPCPVLLGLRGTEPEQLLQTCRSTIPLAAEEPLEGWILWATNQASGDHVTPVDSLVEAIDGMTIRLSATVTTSAETQPGGHVRVAAEDMNGDSLVAMAFEPTKSFRAIVRQLEAGDQVTFTGGISASAIRRESLTIHSCAAVKASNPLHCGRSMKSRGLDAGYKCATCGKTVESSAAVFNDRSHLVGSYEVPIIARRHLHRPLAWEQGSVPRVALDASAPTSAATPPRE
jgi:tRNA(Ile2)-agmatinylcytidine synthase